MKKTFFNCATALAFGALLTQPMGAQTDNESSPPSVESTTSTGAPASADDEAGNAGEQNGTATESRVPTPNPNSEASPPSHGEDANHAESGTDEREGTPPAAEGQSVQQHTAAQWALVRESFLLLDPRKQSATQSNLILSPSTLNLGLEALWLGARGETAQEFARYFGVQSSTLDDDGQQESRNLNLYDSSNQRLAQNWKSGKHSNLGGGMLLVRASSLWIDKEYPLEKSYLDQLEAQGLGSARNVDWSNLRNSLQEVNRWAAESTDGKIDSLLGADDFDRPVAFVLATAVAFAGSWEQSFDPEHTVSGDFTGLDGEKRSAQFMKARLQSRAAKLEDETMLLELPFAGGDQRMIAVLPAETGPEALASLESRIEGMPQWLNALQERTIELTLPKFEVKTTLDTSAALRALGLEQVFESDRADFSGLSERAGLSLDSVQHEAWMKINESGASAAAASAAAVTAKSVDPDSISFKADRPFLFFILDREGEVLFAGRMAHPGRIPLNQ